MCPVELTREYDQSPPSTQPIMRKIGPDGKVLSMFTSEGQVRAQTDVLRINLFGIKLELIRLVVEYPDIPQQTQSGIRFSIGKEEFQKDCALVIESTDQYSNAFKTTARYLDHLDDTT